MDRNDHRAKTLAWILLTLAIGGCSTKDFVRVDPSLPIDLAPDEGLLVFQVDTDLPIEKLILTGLDAGRPIDAGDTFEIVRVPAGRYRWYSLVVPESDRHRGLYRIDPSKYADEDELYFEVQPGVLNYAGELVVSRGRVTWFQRSIYIRVLNHLAGAIRVLEREHPALLDQYALVHARDRSRNDPFLEFYLDARRAKRGVPLEGSRP